MSDILDRVKEINADLATHPVGCRCPGHLLIEIRHLRARVELLEDLRAKEYPAAKRIVIHRTFLDAAKMAEEEPSPAGLSPFSFKDYSVEDVAIATVQATRKSIAARLRRAAEGVK